MTLDTQIIARSLYIYHMRALQQVPHNVTVSACLKSEQPDNQDADPTTTEPSPSSPLTPFIGTDEQPHWLTKLILLQILISDSPTFPSRRVVTHHRRHGDLLTQAQEEAVLIAAFGLLWFGTPRLPMLRGHPALTPRYANQRSYLGGALSSSAR